jgi:hypothetical protein
LPEATPEIEAKSSQQVIVPRKGVLELQRVLTADGLADVGQPLHARAAVAYLQTPSVNPGAAPGGGMRRPYTPSRCRARLNARDSYNYQLPEIRPL